MVIKKFYQITTQEQTGILSHEIKTNYVETNRGIHSIKVET